MRSQTSGRIKIGLKAALARLRAVDKNDREAVWVATSDALAWLYQCEEAERRADVDYYRDRESSPGGRTLAGLIWLRGQLVHRQAEVQVAAWQPVQSHVFNGERWVAKTLKEFDGAEWRPVSLKHSTFIWPSRAQLPIQETDRHRRDLHYERYVQQQPLLPPLEQAAQYLLDR